MRVFTLAGSLRTGSWNKKLLHAAELVLAAHPIEIDHADLDEFELPLYNGDIEATQGFPPGVRRLRERIAAAQALLMVSPEYNHSIPGPLKNAIDWASRPPNQPFKGKAGALMGASTGHYGAVRALAHLRLSLTALGVWLVPSQVLLPNADKAFQPNGTLVDATARHQVEHVVTDLVRLATVLHKTA